MLKDNGSLLLALVLVVAMLGGQGCASTESKDIFREVEKGDLEVAVTTTGELQAKNSIDINGPVGARKAGIYQLKISRLVPEGTIVKPGDFVAELDKSEIVAKVKEVDINLQKFTSQFTQAQLDCTLTLSQARDELINLQYAMEQRKLEKEESIYESPSTKRQAEIEFEKAVRAHRQAQTNYQTKVRQAEAKISEVEADLRKEEGKLESYREILNEFTIAAPEPGMVIYFREWDGKKRVVGSTVSPWQPTVATLPDLTIMESVTYVNEVDIKKVQRGQTVRVSLDADPDKKLNGQVTQVGNIGEQRPNSDSKVFEVKVIINEKDSTLRPAMTTSNEIIIQTLEDVTYIPRETVHAVNDSVNYVYRLEGGNAVKQEVKLGAENENYVVVLSGVTVGEKLFMSIPEKAEELEFITLSN